MGQVGHKAALAGVQLLHFAIMPARCQGGQRHKRLHGQPAEEQLVAGCVGFGGVVGRGAGGIILDFVVVAGLLGIQASLDADIARLDIEHRGGLSVFTHEGGCRRFVVAPLVTERAIGGGKHGERVFRDGFDQCDRVVQPLDMSRKGIAEACRAASGQQCRGSQQEQCLFHGAAVRRPGVIPIRRNRAGRRSARFFCRWTPCAGR